MDEQACRGSYTTPSTSPRLSQEQVYFNLLHGVCRPEFPCNIQRLFCYLTVPKRGAGCAKGPHIPASRCYYPARDFLKVQSLLDPVSEMKYDGEVSLKSKSILSTASVQALLTAGFEI